MKSNKSPGLDNITAEMYGELKFIERKQKLNCRSNWVKNDNQRNERKE